MNCRVAGNQCVILEVFNTEENKFSGMVRASYAELIALVIETLVVACRGGLKFLSVIGQAFMVVFHRSNGNGATRGEFKFSVWSLKWHGVLEIGVVACDFVGTLAYHGLSNRTTLPMSTATDVDGEFFAWELDSFLPERSFDTHTHRWRQEFINRSVDDTATDMGLAEYGSAYRTSTRSGRPRHSSFPA